MAKKKKGNNKKNKHGVGRGSDAAKNQSSMTTQTPKTTDAVKQSSDEDLMTIIPPEVIESLLIKPAEDMFRMNSSDRNLEENSFVKVSRENENPIRNLSKVKHLEAPTEVTRGDSIVESPINTDPTKASLDSNPNSSVKSEGEISSCPQAFETFQKYRTEQGEKASDLTRQFAGEDYSKELEKFSKSKEGTQELMAQSAKGGCAETSLDDTTFTSLKQFDQLPNQTTNGCDDKSNGENSYEEINKPDVNEVFTSNLDSDEKEKIDTSPNRDGTFPLDDALYESSASHCSEAGTCSPGGATRKSEDMRGARDSGEKSFVRIDHVSSEIDEDNESADILDMPMGGGSWSIPLDAANTESLRNGEGMEKVNNMNANESGEINGNETGHTTETTCSNSENDVCSAPKEKHIVNPESASDSLYKSYGTQNNYIMDSREAHAAVGLKKPKRYATQPGTKRLESYTTELSQGSDMEEVDLVDEEQKKMKKAINAAPLVKAFSGVANSVSPAAQNGFHQSFQQTSTGEEEAFGFLTTTLREILGDDAEDVSNKTLRQYLRWKPDVCRAAERFRANQTFQKENSFIFLDRPLCLSQDPNLSLLLQNGMVLAPGELVAKDGSAVMILRATKCNFFSHDCSYRDVCRAIFYVLRNVMEQETMNLLMGVTIILDLVGVARKNIPGKLAKILSKATGCFPIRIRAICVVSMPWWFPSSHKRLFSPKLRERIHFLKDKKALTEFIDKDRLLEEDGGIYNFDLQSWMSSTVLKEVETISKIED